MHNLKHLTQTLNALRTTLEAHDGAHGVDVDLQMWTGGITAIRFAMSYRTEPGFGGDREEFVRSLTLDEIETMDPEDVEAWWGITAAGAKAWVRDIPSPEEIAHKAFMAQLGRLIDKGREVGVDVDFLNPLTAMMEKLATNALEDKRNK